MSDYVPPLVHLPGTKLTPEVLLHRTLNNKDRIKAVVTVIMWDDGSVDTECSSMTKAEFCMMGMVLHDQALKQILPD
jgi:hypothetical protein